VTPLLVAAGAAVGAPLRLLAGHWLDHGFPWGTLVVNVAGSFLLGILSALSLGDQAYALLGTGFCGGFTTYSAFAVKAHERGPAGGTAYVGATLVLALGACALGYLLGSAA
jgi:fluoride exporter